MYCCNLIIENLKNKIDQIKNLQEHQKAVAKLVCQLTEEMLQKEIGI